MNKFCCHQCLKEYLEEPGTPIIPTPMIGCSECGNKRCPKAANHGNACTRSNELGQPGSRYA